MTLALAEEQSLVDGRLAHDRPQPREIRLALGPALAIGHGAQHVGSVEVRASDPTVHLRVDIGDIARSTTNPEGAGEPDLVVSGDALDLVEQLSVRRPITPEVEPARAWLLGGLAAAFDQPVD